MHKYKDQLSKRIAVESSTPMSRSSRSGALADAQRMDLSMSRGSRCPRQRPCPASCPCPCAWPGAPAQIEFCARHPRGSDEVRDGQRRQLEWHQHRRVEGPARGARRRPPLCPLLVHLSGDAAGLLRAAARAAGAGVAAGLLLDGPGQRAVVHRGQRAGADAAKSVLLRLFGSTRSRAEALEDIGDMPTGRPGAGPSLLLVSWTFCSRRWRMIRLSLSRKGRSS